MSAVLSDSADYHERMERAAARYLGHRNFKISNLMVSTADGFPAITFKCQPDGRDRQPLHCVWNSKSDHLSCHDNDWFEKRTEIYWRKYLLPLTKAPTLDELTGKQRFPVWKPKTYCEVGCCEARSLRWVFEYLGIEKATVVDPWQAPRVKQQRAFEEYYDRALKNMSPWLGAGRVNVVRERSQRYLRGPDAPRDQSFDFVYCDGDHRGHECMTDLVLAWWKLKVGGILAVDDFNRRWSHSQPAVWEAGTGFLLAFDHLCDIVYKTKKAFAVRKHHHE